MNSTTSYSRTMNGLTDIVADSITTDTLTLTNLTAQDIVCNTLNAATSITTDTLLTNTGTLAIGAKVSQSTGTRNVSYGIGSMTGTQTGTDNVCIGNNSGKVLTSGNTNTYVGSEAGATNTASNNNVGIGYRALTNNSTSANTAIGANALANITANATTAVGFFALTNLTSGTSNNAFGLRCLETLTTGDANTGMGQQALRYLQNGLHNTSTGFSADINNLTGSFNTCIGSSSGHQATTYGQDNNGNSCLGYMTEISGDFNTLIGYQAGNRPGGYRTAVNYSVGLGYQATPNADHQIKLGTENEYIQCDNYLNATNYITTATPGPTENSTKVATTAFVQSAISALSGVSLSANNIFTGFNTFANKVSAYNDASFNVSYGYNAMAVNTNNGSYNHAFGYNSGNKLASSATNNTYFGYNTGANNISGTDCVFIGSGCGSNSLSHKNVSIGSRADEDLTTGSSNVSIGYLAGASNISYTTGNNNVHIGAGSVANGGSYNTFIGFQTTPPTITTSFSTAIGHDAKATNSYQIALGTAANYIEGFGYMILPTLPENSNNTKVVNAEYVDRAIYNINTYNKTCEFVDDFLSGLDNTAVRWNALVSGVGPFGAFQASEVRHPGLYRLNIGTVANAYIGLIMNTNTIYTDDLTSVEFVWRYNNNYTNSQIHVGYAQGVNTFTTSACFRYTGTYYQAFINGTVVYTFNKDIFIWSTSNLAGRWLYGKITTDLATGVQTFYMEILNLGVSDFHSQSGAVTSALITPICRLYQTGSTIAQVDVDYCRVKYTSTRL